MMTLFGIGNLTKDLTLKEIPEMNTCVVEFTLGCSERRKIKGESVEKTVFLNFQAWDSAAKLLVAHLQKGDPLCVTGLPRIDEWVGPDGTKRTKHYYRITDFQFCGKAKRNQTTVTEEVETKEEDPSPDF